MIDEATSDLFREGSTKTKVAALSDTKPFGGSSELMTQLSRRHVVHTAATSV